MLAPPSNRPEFPMPAIDIHHPHARPLSECRAVVERMAAKIGERMEVTSTWRSEDTLEFSRAGVDGSIRLLPDEVHVAIELSWLLTPLKGLLESEIQRVLQRELA